MLRKTSFLFLFLFSSAAFADAEFCLACYDDISARQEAASKAPFLRCTSYPTIGDPGDCTVGPEKNVVLINPFTNDLWSYSVARDELNWSVLVNENQLPSWKIAKYREAVELTHSWIQAVDEVATHFLDHRYGLWQGQSSEGCPSNTALSVLSSQSLMQDIEDQAGIQMASVMDRFQAENAFINAYSITMGGRSESLTIDFGEFASKIPDSFLIRFNQHEQGYVGGVFADYIYFDLVQRMSESGLSGLEVIPRLQRSRFLGMTNMRWAAGEIDHPCVIKRFKDLLLNLSEFSAANASETAVPPGLFDRVVAGDGPISGGGRTTCFRLMYINGELVSTLMVTCDE